MGVIVVVDEVNSSLTDRELLILLNERLTNLRDEIKFSNERYQKEIDTLNIAIEKINSTLSMYRGALIFLGALITALGTLMYYI